MKNVYCVLYTKYIQKIVAAEIEPHTEKSPKIPGFRRRKNSLFDTFCLELYRFSRVKRKKKSLTNRSVAQRCGYLLTLVNILFTLHR